MMRLTYSKGSDFKFFEDYYIGVLLDREAEAHALIFRENWKNARMNDGYIFAPYVPVMLTPIIVSGEIKNKNKRVYSRYAMTLGELTHESR